MNHRTRGKPQNPYLTLLIKSSLILVGAAGLLTVYYFALAAMDRAGTFRSTTSLADVDNDGDLDVVLHNLRTEAEFTAFGGATLWRNNGHGRFAAQEIPDGGGWTSATADFNQDGAVDLVTFDGVRLSLWQNGAEGELGLFGGWVRVPGPVQSGQFGSVHLGDLNGDGRTDAFVAGCCGRLFTVKETEFLPNMSWLWLNDWTQPGRPAASTAVDALAGLVLRDAALGDLDGDGDLDLFAAVIAPPKGLNADPADRVLWNDGVGHFSDSGQRLGRVDSTAVALADVDGDGDLDALTGHATGAALWLNEGGTLVPSAQKMQGGAITAVFLQDLDGDGDIDALIGEMRQARIWWNGGDGVFTRSDQRFRYSRRDGLAVGDFDGDGRPDIFAAAYDDDYRIWFNQGSGMFR
ncbi:MAG: VCBS repeat-containing protein [Anaerolineaceae bacterium]|nr:VCBS repeat-containing protein [Anaerolineaceae bacterium]